MNWNKVQPVTEDRSTEWARLMKDQSMASEAAQSLRKEITRRVGQSSKIPPDLLGRVDAADQQIEREQKRQRAFLERWARA